MAVRPSVGVAYLAAFLALSQTLDASPSPADPVAECEGRLKTIHKALVAYERDHQHWPDHLSDLLPK